MQGNTLATIAVDLTPVLPGGENGGAKIFTLELLRRLADMAPETKFVLLTQAASHEELASMDRANVSRRMVVGPTLSKTVRPTLEALARRLLPHLPSRLRGRAMGLAYRLHSALKRGGSGTLLGDIGADLLFCPFTAPTYFEPGVPTVCTIYDLQYKTYPQFFTAEDVAHRERTFIEASRRATVLSAISDYSRDSAIIHGNLDPTRIRTIHLRMAHRIVADHGNAADTLSRLGLMSQRYLVYPANFWKHKNHEMLLTAFGMACHAGLPEDIRLVCTGAPGPRQAWLTSAAQAMNLGKRIMFPGYLSNDELAIVMANAAGVIFPSLYEGFGLPVIEAMAAGVPVACSNITSLPEVAAGSAILFDPRIPTEISDSIVRLENDEALRRRLIDSGKQRAIEFADSERMAREYWELFLDAMGRSSDVNQLCGVYPDGWGAGRLSLSLARSDEDRILQLRLAVPDWLPTAKVRVEVFQSAALPGSAFEVSRGEERILSIPLTSGIRKLHLQVSPTFVPSVCGLGEDTRELSVLVKNAAITSADGASHLLFPEVADDPEHCHPDRQLNPQIEREGREDRG